MIPVEGFAEQRLGIDSAVEVIDVHDDNLNFSVEEPMRDRIRRITPTLALRIDSPRWSARGAYGLDSESYATHSGLDNPRARQRALFDIRYEAAPRLTLSMNSAYLDTNTLADLNEETGLAALRVRGRRLSIAPSASFRISPRLTVQASASTITTKVENEGGFRERVQTIRVEHRVTRRDLFTFDYDHRHVVFEDERDQSLDTQTVYGGWHRDLSQHTQLVLRGGPRFTNGVRGADFAASLIHSWKSSSISFSFDQNQTTVIGYVGAVETQSVQTRFTWSPGQKLIAYAAPAMIRSKHRQLEGTVQRVRLGARYAVTPMLGLDINYNLDTQKGAIDPRHANAELSHATLSLGFSTRWRSDKTRATDQ